MDPNVEAVFTGFVQKKKINNHNNNINKKVN